MFGRTKITYHDPYAAQAALLRQQVEWHREQLRRALADCTISSSKIADATVGSPSRQRYKHTNCPNCAAPSEPGRCSYCLTPTETL